MFYKTLASTLAISVAMTSGSFAQDKSAPNPEKPIVEDAKPKAAQDGGLFALAGLGGAAGVAAPSESDGEDRLTENVTIANKTDGLGAIIAIGAVEGSGGEDRLTENVTVAGNGGGGKVDVQDINLVKYAKDPKLGPIKGESQDKAMGSGSGAGKANFQDLSLARGGEDRLTENVTIEGGGGGKVDVQDINIVKYAKDPKIGDIKGESLDKAPACVTEAGAVDANCNGLADADEKTEENRFDREDIRKRPEPRQQRR